MISGMLMINCIAPYFFIQTTAFISLGCTVLSILGSFWIPESPYHLIMKDRIDDARKTLHFLRRCDVTEELQDINDAVKRQISETGTFKDLVSIRNNRVALLITIGLITVQQMTGSSAWNTYAQTIFMNASPDISPVLAAALYYVAFIVIQILGSLQVDKYGRKPLFMLSSLLTGLDLIAGAIYFYLQEHNICNMSNLQWIPLVIMTLYVIVYGLGLSILPILIVGEILPTSIKGKALGFSCLYFAAVVSATIKMYASLAEYGQFWPFLIFGLCTLLSVAFGYFVLPETKGKSLEEIQQHLRG